MRSWLHILMALCWVNAVSAQKLKFDHLTIEDGLSQSTVNAILQDRYGFMWFGTAGGLNTYDGYSMLALHHNLLDSTSLSNDWITALWEDGSGTLWVGTIDGLNRMDASRRRFTRMDVDSALHITALTSGADGSLWIGSRQGLFRMNKDLKIVRLDSRSVTGMAVSTTGQAWIAGPTGILRYEGDAVVATEMEGQSIADIRRDHAGHIWLVTTDGRLFRIAKGGGAVESYDPLLKRTGNARVTRIMEDRGGWIWIGTASEGLFRLDPKRERVIDYTEGRAEGRNVSRGDVYSLFEDRTGIIWVGTSQGGISKLGKTRGRFKVARHEGSEASAILDNNIWSIAEDRDGNLWFGTERGVCFLDRSTGAYRHYLEDELAEASGSARVLHLSEDSEGKIWCGGVRGLYRVDPKTGKTEEYRHTQERSKPMGPVRTVYGDRSGGVWISTSSGLEFFNSGVFTKPLAIDGVVYCLMEDAVGNLWAGTMNGLYRIDPDRKTFRRFSKDTGETGLDNEFVLSLLPVADGSLWVGTYGGGVYRFQPADESFVSYNNIESVAGSIVYGILPGNNGQLWLSTNRGLVRFAPEYGTARAYDVSDGLSSNEFNPGAYCRTRAGELFFGNVNGSVSFFPDEIQDNPYVPPVLVTAFKTFDRVRQFQRPIWEASTVELSYRDNFFSFEFAALDYNNPSKNRYAYRLEGFDAGWVYCGNRRYASYTNLSPGEYIFRVRGSNDDLVWSDRDFSLRVIIVPPFWQRWWFYGVAVLSIAVSIYALHAYRVREQIRHTLDIQRVRHQESERVRKKAADDFHDEFGHKLTKITLLCEVLKNENPDQRLATLEVLNKVQNTAKTLSVGMRDFLWTLNPEKDSLYETAVRLKDFGDELFDRTGIAFTVEGLTDDMNHVKLTMEWRRNLTLIFKESMNNILKHAHCTHVHLSFDFHPPVIHIRLNDDGSGFDSSNGYRGQGLSSIRNRAQKLNAELTIQSQVGSGTVVHFRGPIADPS